MLRRKTDQLQEGDVVLNHGMRILIDGPARTEPGTNGHDLTRYRWPGLVLNADELCDPASLAYDTYIYKHLRGVWWEDRVPRTRKDDWPVVGNCLAWWSVGEPWREQGSLFEDDGQPGGDAQSGKAYSRRFVHTKLPGRLFTVYAYPITGDGTDDRHPEGVTRIEQQAEMMICRNIEDPGSTEVWSEYTYDDLPEHFDRDCGDIKSAERLAKLLIETFDPDRFIGWDGKPDYEI